MPVGHHATVGATLKDLKGRFFIGREYECQTFANALAGAPRQWRILNVYGEEGIGKSTLLDAYRRLAEDAGALYVYLDGRDIRGAQEAFTARVSDRLGVIGGEFGSVLGGCVVRLSEEISGRPVVLAFDAYEEMSALDRWLRESFLPRLPSGLIVVIASRRPLHGAWRQSDAWRQLVKPLHLKGFDFLQVCECLRRHQIVDPELQTAVWRFTRGHPLALSLAIDLAEREGEQVLTSLGESEVVDELAQHFLTEVADSRLLPLLDAAAVAQRFDQDLLAELVREPVDPRVFDDLVRLSFIRREGSAWVVQDPARDVIVRVLRSKSPSRYRETVRGASLFMAGAAATTVDDRERTSVLAQLLRLYGEEAPVGLRPPSEAVATTVEARREAAAALEMEVPAAPAEEAAPAPEPAVRPEEPELGAKVGAAAGARDVRRPFGAQDVREAGSLGLPRDGLAPRLTSREYEVAKAVLEGLSNAEIAALLHVSEVTVKKHLTHVFSKTGVLSRTQLIKWLQGRG